MSNKTSNTLSSQTHLVGIDFEEKELTSSSRATLNSGFSELVVAFVAPLGVDLKSAEDAARERLEAIGYTVLILKITEVVLPKLDTRAGQPFPDAFSRIGTMMDVGNDARKEFGNDVLAYGIAAHIASLRPKPRASRPKTAYLIHSLKHPEEVRRLREIYPRGFYLIAVNAPPAARKSYLNAERALDFEKSELLMQRDKKENVSHGQQVNKTFHLADFFVGWSEDPKRIKNSIYRFIDIIFGDPHRTPTFGEYSMFMAFAASLRSGDLSRQVGAVIARDGELLGTGANDCPKAGGGLYWPIYNQNTHQFEDYPDGRDSARGVDSNRKAQIQIVQDIIDKCQDVGINSDELGKVKQVLEDSDISQLTEFGRVVHAEMEALLSCARKGVSTRNATIYCTTFPCHNCAKHIIAAGIDRVVFVEPYLKSKAKSHHDEVIRIEYPVPAPEPVDDSQVRFEPFFGVGPRRFFDLFSMNMGIGSEIKRKDDKTGRATEWHMVGAKPRIRMQASYYLGAERRAEKRFSEILQEAGR
jgi:deoxycytidylate deaminase